MKAGTHGSIARRTRVGVLSLAALLAIPAIQAGAAEAPAEAKTEGSRAEMQRKLEDAQKRLDAAANEVATLSISMSEDAMPRFRAFSTMGRPRAALGMAIGLPGMETRTDGVEVMSVSPGGSAAAAGIKAGDVLTEVDGKSLKRDDGEGPRDKLLKVMRDVKPDQKVSLKYLRDGKVASADVTAQPVANHFYTTGPMMFRGEAGGMPAMPGMPSMPRLMFGRAEGVFGSAELVPLTPKLGQYFGAEKGLLVVRAPDDSRLKLEDGDVILDVDGRVPSSPTHALRILGSYQPGEKLKLNVLRMKKRLSFEVTVPEGGEAGMIERSRFSLGFGPGVAPAPRLEMMGPIGPGPGTFTVPAMPPVGDEPTIVTLPAQPTI